MEITVLHKSNNNTIPLPKNFNMTKLAFVKHMAEAGQHFAPNIEKIFRIVGMFLHYSFYMQRSSFCANNCFSRPPDNIYDPTEQGQFSNLVGRAIADFLSKKIDNSMYTVSYEAAMRLMKLPIQGGMPDLIAFPHKSSYIAIEAKGFERPNVSDKTNGMVKYKTQAQSGPIKAIGRYVACVSYNLYDPKNGVKCKYYDPPNDNFKDDGGSLKKELSKGYYSGLLSFMEYFEYEENRYDNEKFYEIKFSNIRKFNKFFYDELFPLRPFCSPEIYEFCLKKLRLILPGDIRNFAKEGITDDLKPFNFEPTEKKDVYKNIYIDNDRVGLRYY